jgi:signal transduction histidine kinase
VASNSRSPLGGVSVKTEAVLFRTFQEAMHNVAKHAAPGRCASTSSGTATGVELEVVDDGVGFDPGEVGDRVTSAGGLGLRQMRRARRGAGRRLDVVSRPAGHRVPRAVPG